jgi:tripartite-type tricarboxylate transporter receptor subunit TctC
MIHSPRSVLLRCALVACTTLAGMHATAQDYPARTVRMIDGFAPGGNTDVLARILGQALSEGWPHPVVVENRPGASGNLGAEVVARATPDGHTLLMGWITTIAISTSLYPTLNYQPVKDLAPVGLVASSLLVLLAHPSLPVRSVKELIALAKARPGELNYASCGQGCGTHLAAELFRLRAGVDIVHLAYKGGAPAVAAIAAGESQIGFASLAASMPLTKAGKVRSIAVTSPQRARMAQDLPTIAEAGFPGFDLTTWYGLFAPTGTPATVINRLNGDLVRVLAKPEVVARLEQLGLEAKSSTPEQFGGIFRKEIALYAGVIRQAGIKPE